MPNALLVADDLTGAMDTGHEFAARDRGVRVLRRGTGDEPLASDRADRPTVEDEDDILVVDTDTRDEPADAAATAVSAAIAAFPAPLVYKKLDSTLRGNVAAEIDAAVGATDADLAVVAPAFPDAGRTVADGRIYVDGTPVADAGYGLESSALRTILDSSRYRVETLPATVVDDGPDAVRSALDRANRPDEPVLVACDANSDRHLEAIAVGADAVDTTVLFAGSGGLARHVSAPGGPGIVDRPTGNGSGTLAVVGSVNDRTLAQLEAVSDDLVVRLDPGDAVRDPTGVGAAAAPALEDRLDRRGRAVVTAATTPVDVEYAETAGDEYAHDPGNRVANALATAAARTAERTPPAGLVLTGGDVAERVLEALDATAIGLAGAAPDAGVPEGRIVDGPAAGTRLVTKAGGFGDERAIVNCLNHLGGGD